MPDDRLFHPRLLQSDKVDRLTDFERGVWLVTRLVCDDFGVMRAAANTLQGAARFLEGKPAKAIQRALVALDRVGLLQTFEHEGRAYIFQWDWQDWQKVTYPRGTLHPRPPAESLSICSRSTQELFEKHPGGWGRKKPERSENVSETVPERFEPVSLKPLAVSQEPLAVSRQPVAGEPASLADARSKRPIFKGSHFVVWEWQFDDLRRLLGAHFDAFDVHAWFDALDRNVSAAALVVPQRDGGKWLQEQTLSEAIRRGLPVAASAAAPMGKTAGNAAAAARFVARGRA